MPSKLACLFVPLLLVTCGGGNGGGNIAASSPGTPPAAPSFLQMAADGIATLQGDWYNQTTGLWNTTGWWNAANVVTVLADYSKLSNSTQYIPAISNTFALNSGGGFLNNYYDDEGWWGINSDWCGRDRSRTSRRETPPAKPPRLIASWPPPKLLRRVAWGRNQSPSSVIPANAGIQAPCGGIPAPGGTAGTPCDYRTKCSDARRSASSWSESRPYLSSENRGRHRGRDR